MNKAVNRSVIVAGWLLAISALLGTGILWLTNWHTEPYIDENERQALLRSLNAVIAAGSYDNDLLVDNIGVHAGTLTANSMTSTVYRARRQGEPVAVAITCVAPDGYNGDILLLVGIDYAGTVTGVRVIKHRETPGLGDGIEKERSDWIDIFTGRSRNNPDDDHWKVNKDGGEFMQLTGATITPRAVVKAVHRALVFYTEHRETLFNLDSNKTYNADTEQGKSS
jgi:electron transport complex protein RnfG